MKVFKYPLSIVDEQLVAMPRGATILSAQLQRDVLCLWALVDERAEIEERRIAIIGTGNPMPECGVYVFIDTFQVERGALVFHVFEHTSRDPS